MTLCFSAPSVYNIVLVTSVVYETVYRYYRSVILSPQGRYVVLVFKSSLSENLGPEKRYMS